MLSLNHRRIFCSAAAGVLVAASLTLQAATTDFGRVDVSLSAREDYDSNIYLTSSDIDDYVTTGSAAVNFTRDVALLNSQASVGATGKYYSRHTGLNTVDPFVNGALTFTPTDKTTVNGSASYARVTGPNETVHDITTSDNLDLGGSFQNLFSEKLGYRLSAGYKDDNYQTANYAETLSYNGGLSAVYVYSPKLTITGNYTHRESWVKDRPKGSGNPASKDERFTVGFEGELAPKTSGVLEVGAQHRKFDNAAFGSGEDGFYAAVKLKWVPAEKTAVNIDLTEDFDTTATAQSAKAGSAQLTVTQTLDKEWSIDGSVGYSHGQFRGGYEVLKAGHLANDQDRTDDTYRIKGRIVYAIATNVNIDLSAGYSHTDSTFAVSTYNRAIVGVGLTASF